MASKKIKQEERKMYIGPNISKYGLLKGQVFKNGYPINLDELVLKVPLMKELFVKISEISIKEKLIDKNGSKISVAYKAAKGVK